MILTIRLQGMPFLTSPLRIGFTEVNIYDITEIPNYVPINVTVNCTCGDKQVSRDYGLFATYPLRPGENLSSLEAESGVPADLLEKYNLGTDFNAGGGIVYVPAKG